MDDVSVIFFETKNIEHDFFQSMGGNVGKKQKGGKIFHKRKKKTQEGKKQRKIIYYCFFIFIIKEVILKTPFL